MEIIHYLSYLRSGFFHSPSSYVPPWRPNAASLRINTKLGFAPTGKIVDGELIFELRLGAGT
jgi:hypothetical protein